ELPLLGLVVSPDPFLHLSDLPSFPTRRSSDLLLRAGLGPLSLSFQLNCLPTPPPLFGKSTTLPSPPIASRLVTSTGARCLALFIDRKSTRLNSSHQIISYAVFCSQKQS